VPALCMIGDISLAPVDLHGGPYCPHMVAGPAVMATATVVVGGRPAMSVGARGVHFECTHCCGHNEWIAVQGSSTVAIEGFPVVRIGDQTLHCGGVGTMITGSGEVEIGGEPTSPEPIALEGDGVSLAEILGEGLNLDDDVRRKLLWMFAKADNQQILALEAVLSRLSPAQAQGAMHGDHILLIDDGKLYEELRAYGAFPRTGLRSHSHKNYMVDAYGIDLPSPGHILFGIDKSNGGTRVQFEEHSPSPTSLLPHLGSWAQGKLGWGKPNKGLFDMDSDRTDADPVIIVGAMPKQSYPCEP